MGFVKNVLSFIKTFVEKISVPRSNGATQTYIHVYFQAYENFSKTMNLDV